MAEDVRRPARPRRDMLQQSNDLEGTLLNVDYFVHVIEAQSCTIIKRMRFQNYIIVCLKMYTKKKKTFNILVLNLL